MSLFAFTPRPVFTFKRIARFILMLFATLVGLVFTSQQNARAEYRAFELRIDNTEKGTSRPAFSTFDQIQYPRFYPLAKNEVIHYVDSWMCFENMSNFRKMCAKPDRAPAAASPPAAAPKPKSP